MATLTELEARREALDQAIGSGRLKVRYADREETYHSIADLQRARSFVQRQIDKLEGVKRPKSIKIAYRSGY